MTTPYTTGTVSVTAGSTTATGVGTGWKTAGLVAGIFGLDSADGNPVPVLSVDSDTKITFAKPWRGATANDQPYWITYDTTDGQQTVSLMEKVVEYISRLNKPALASLASLTPAADKLPYFGPGGAGALADFNAAARALLAGTGVINNAQTPPGLRADEIISDANAFTTRGWARGNNIPNAPTNTGDGDWYIYRNDTLSGWGRQWAYSFFTNKVFQRRYTSSGFTAWMQDDAPEHGSNVNGDYTRFADGTLICWRGFTTGGPNIAAGGYVKLTSDGAVYPASFASPPRTFVSYKGDWTIVALATSVNGTSNHAGELNLKNTDQDAHSFPGFIEILAIGRWY